MKSKTVVSISFDNDLIEKIKKEKGKISFSKYLNDLLRDILKI